MLILRAVQSCHVKDVCIHLDKFISHLVEDSVFLYLECDTGCNQGSLISKGLMHLSISLKPYADSCRTWSQQIYTFTFMPTANSNSPFQSKSLYCGRKTEYPEKTVCQVHLGVTRFTHTTLYVEFPLSVADYR